MTGKPTIWFVRIGWSCGDGCCSESWYELSSSDNKYNGDDIPDIQKIRSMSQEQIIGFFAREYPDYALDLSKCNHDADYGDTDDGE